MENILTQELIDKLIAHYEKGLAEIKLMYNIQDILDVLVLHNMESGLCKCAHGVFNTSICEDRYLRDRYTFMNWVALPPFMRNTKEKIIESLEFRIKLMKEFPN